MRQIVKVHVCKMTESCERTTYIVHLTNDEGFVYEPDSYASHCIYNDLDGTKGLSVEEARDRALTTAADWADFLELEVTPFYEDGVLHEPMMTFERYTGQREEKLEDATALLAGKASS